MGRPESGGQAAEQAVLYFRVADIESAHNELISRGVEFIDAPHIIFTHADSTEEWMAFFKDPDGGTLALMEQRRVTSG